MVGHDGFGHPTAVGAAQPAGVQQDPEPLQRAALAAVGDVRLVQQRRPVARGRGEVPDGTARPGPVEVNQGHGPAVAEDQIGGVGVVVADQVGHADQGGVGERVLSQGRDGGLPVDVGQGLDGGIGRQHPGGAVEADLGQVGEQGVGREPAGRGRAAHGVTDPDDQTAIGGAAGQRPRAKAPGVTG